MLEDPIAILLRFDWIRVLEYKKDLLNGKLAKASSELLSVIPNMHNSGIFIL